MIFSTSTNSVFWVISRYCAKKPCCCQIGMRVKGNFSVSQKTFILGCGAQKSGTTWAHHYIENSKYSNMGLCKEYHIWDALFIPEFKDILITKDTMFRSNCAGLRYKMQNDLVYYFDYFSLLLQGDSANITSDISPSYSGLKRDIFMRIFEGFDNRNVECKVVFLMRDPIERCWSNLRHERNRKRIDGPKSDDITFLRSLYKSRRCELRTRYDITINEIENAFPKNNCYFGIYESMHTEGELIRLSEFIGIDYNIEFVTKKFNVGRKYNELNSVIENEIVQYYDDVYKFCGERFPQTKSLWKGFMYA
jgi:hypothetical protein